MSDYNCDNWVVIKFNTEEHGIFYKVLVGTSGGYLDGDSWRMVLVGLDIVVIKSRTH